MKPNILSPKSWAITICLLFAVAPSVVLAQAREKPRAAKVTQVAFFQLEVAGVEAKVSTIVSDAIIAELSKMSDIKVIGSKEIDAMLSFEQKKQMTGCTDASCMVAIGGALGVDKIVTGNIGKLGESHVFNLKLLDIRSATMERLFNKRLKGGSEEAFLDLVPEALATLFPAHAASLRQRGAAPAIGAAAKQGTPASSYMPWVLIGTGGAALIAGGVVHGLAAGEYSDYKSLPESDPALKDKWQSINTKTYVAYAMYGVGALAAGGGLAWYFLAGPSRAGKQGTSSLNFIPLAGETIGGAVAGSW